MARYILIDRTSGYIFADTAALPGFDAYCGTPIDAAVCLDAEIKNPPADYAETSRHDAAAVYDVYSADVRGSEAIAIVTDGQDQDAIEAVERICAYVTSLARSPE